MIERKDFGSRYYATSNGHIYTKAYRGTISNQSGTYSANFKEKEIGDKIGTTGDYRQVTIDGELYCVHKVIAELFIPNPDNLPVANHLDGDKHNCAASNLEWSTHSDNQKHAYDTGLKRKLKGHDNGNQKHSEELIKEIYLAAVNKIASQEMIGIMFGVPQITVSNIKTKKTWRHITDLLDDVH